MSLKKLFNSIKEARLPYHLSHDEDELNPHVCIDENLCCQARLLSSFEIPPDSPKETILDTSPILRKFASHPYLKTPEHTSLDHLDKRSIAAQRKKLAKKYFQNDRALDKPKIRSQSLQRVMPDELCKFSQYKYTIRTAKQKCNLNLWFLLEMTKGIYTAQKNYCLHNLIHDFGSLVFEFMFSPMRKLRFYQFKHILESLEDLENTVQDRLKNKHDCKSAAGFAAKDQNHRLLHFKEDLDEKGEWTQLQAKKVPSSSIVNLIPGIFGHNAVKEHIEHSSNFTIKKLSSNADDRVLYEKLAIVLSKAKFLMAQIGHLLHYEQLSSSLSEFLNNKGGFRRRSPLEIVSNCSIKNRERPFDSYGSRCSTTVCNSLPSIELEEDKQNSMRLDLNGLEHLTFSNRINNFLFEARSFLEDFDEKAIETKLEKLRNYCVYKAKKWFKIKKKAEVQQKYDKFEIVCKICEQKIHIEKMKEHSKLCCKKAEANKGMRDADKKLGELIFEAFMKTKELETSLRVDNKNYDKLKVKSDRSRGSTPKTSAAAKLINANLIKETGSRSSVTDSTDDTLYFDFLKTNGIRRYNTASIRDTKEAMPRAQTGKSEDLKKCIEELNNSFGPENDGSTPERNREDLNVDADDDPNLAKNIIVKRFLDKQNPRCEDNQSTDSSQPKKKRIPRLELQISKKGSGINPSAPEEVNFGYYSDPQKSDLDTENSEDSKGADESVGSLSIPPMKKSESCLGSDELLPNSEANDSHTSIKDSPSETGCKTQPTAPKKSKFYNQTFFTFEQNLHPQGDKNEANNEPKLKEEEQKIDPTKLFPTHSSEAVLGSETLTSPNENLGVFPPLLRTAVKTHSMIVDGESKKSEEEKIDTKVTEQMIKLRLQISKKKEAIKVYEIIKKDGKRMMNKEPYKWKMERDRDDVFNELNSILAKINDNEVKAFAENFKKTFDKRLISGKTYQEVKKLLENPQPKSSDLVTDMYPLDKIPFTRTNSLRIPLRRGFPDRDPTEKDLDNLDRSLTKIQATFGENKPHNNLSNSLYLDHFDKEFENIDDKSRLLSDRSLGKRSGELRGNKFTREDLTPPSPISDISVGYNTYNQLELFRTLGDDDQDNKADNNQNLDISLTEVRPNLENDDNKIGDFQIMSIDSPSKLIKTNSHPKEENNHPPEMKQNIFQLDCPRVSPTADEQQSPETPSFDIRDNPSPMIWRTSTAPARQIGTFQLGLIVPKNNNNNNEDFGGIKIVEKGNNYNKSDDESDSESNEMPLNIINIPKAEKEVPAQLEEEEDCDDGIKPRSRTGSRNNTTVGIQRPKTRDLIGITSLRKRLEETKSKRITRNISISTTIDHHSHHKDGEAVIRSNFFPKEQRIFAEDIVDQNDEEEKVEKCDSPILESSLLQKGYFSDTQAKNVRVLSKKNQAIGFEPVKLISKGAFGRVWLVRRKATNDLYAMKVVNLAERSLKNTQELENLRKENKIFGLAQEDFVVRALFTFTHDTSICFVMEYMIGGDFGDILYTYSALDEDVARFYIAEIVLALEYLHSLGIVHRDLKPDNILLDKHGHAKLTDFGLSETGLSQIIKKTLQYEPESPMICQRRMRAMNKLCSVKRELDNKLNLKVKDKLIDRKNEAKSRKEEEKDKDNEAETSGKKKSKKHQRLIGTPDYMAPEIILGKSITNFSIDWWSLGVILFEFLCGIPPFNDDTPEKIYENIVKLTIPWDQIKIGYDEDCMSPEAADLIKNLLVLDHTKRLGANGADEIKRHPFFKDINWETLRKETAKIIPEQASETDTTNFLRMNSRLNEKDKVNPFESNDLTKTSSNVKDAKEFLEASVDKFDIFNYFALNSDNLKNVEETLKEKERLLDELKKGCDDKENNKMYDDIFDTPK